MHLKPLLTLALVLTTLPVLASVKAYFNYNNRTSYVDPYRRITRTGDNLEQVLLNEIAKAQRTIFMAVQEFRLPLVAKALVAKKNAGVDVRVVLEHDYNFTVLSQREVNGEHESTKVTELRALVDWNRDGRISRAELENMDAVYMLQQAKIPIMDDTFDSSRGSGLMHHKFLVVDGKSTVISTANFTLSCIHGDLLFPNSRGNANSMLAVQSVALARIFQDEFLQMWGNGRRGNFGHNKTYRGPQIVTVRNTKITIQFSPTSARYHWDESVNGLIGKYLAQATNTVIGALFVFSDQNLANVLERRSRAGVKVGFLIEPKFAYRDYSEMLDMMGVQMLNQKCGYEPENRPWQKPATEAGIVGLPQGDVLHHKFAVIDGKTVVMGSQNWSDAANFVNDETLIVIQDKAISDQYTQEYVRLRSRARMGIPASVMSEIRRLEDDCSRRGLYF